MVRCFVADENPEQQWWSCDSSWCQLQLSSRFASRLPSEWRRKLSDAGHQHPEQTTSRFVSSL